MKSLVVRDVFIAAGLIAVMLMYLGLSISSAIAASMMWCAQGALGSIVFRRWATSWDSITRLLLLLGPAPLLGIGVVTALFLFVGGGVLGTAVVVLALIAGLYVSVSANPLSAASRSFTTIEVLVVLAAMALFSNVKEFPNLLLPALGTLLLVTVLQRNRSVIVRVSAVIAAGTLLISALFSRTSYWWTSSDDTATLAGFGTIIVKQGQVEDIAGWPTASHHWFLHAWLALWRQLSGAGIFEVYMIAAPFVLALSMLASLWLILEAFVGKPVDRGVFVFVAIIVAGLSGLEWSIPHQQQPFIYAMVALGGLFVSGRSQKKHATKYNNTLLTIGGLIVASLFFYYLKPTLIVAMGLIVVGIVIHEYRMSVRQPVFIAIFVSLAAVFSGLWLMGIGSTWVSRMSFTAFSVDYFPKDLGWCETPTLTASVVCVLSTNFSHVLVLIVSLGALTLMRTSMRFSISPLMLTPLLVSYLPFRYFISTDVGSGAPSFHQIGEQGLVLLVAVVLASVLVNMRDNRTGIFILVVAGILVTSATGVTRQIAESLEPTFRSTWFLRYLPLGAVVVFALTLLLVVGITWVPTIWKWPSHKLLVVLVVAAVLPIINLVHNSVVTDVPPSRTSRPVELLGPSDIEEISTWIHQNTPDTALLATNYLCEAKRLQECTRLQPMTSCPLVQPILMPGWALTALSERDFLYLSQSWFASPKYFFLHDSSTRLSNDVSIDNVEHLEQQGVSYFVASKDHTAPQVWALLTTVAVFSSENFAVIPLATLRDQLRV